MKEFFKNFGCGAAIGVAVIIPGVSGGTLAVLLNVYDKLISAISNLRKDFKNSIKFLFPIVLGIVVAFAAMYFPLQFALERAPLPTVLLFVGLMLGSFPKLFKDSVKLGFKKTDIINIIIPLAAVIGICFIPNIGDVNLGADMPAGTYFMLVLMGAIAACALVIPGVSGSMMMMIFGYFEPVLATFKGLFTNFGHSAAVLALFALGIVVGFFSIAKLMKLFLDKFPRGTHWAIIGFVIGSIPAILIKFNSNYGFSSLDAVQIAVGIALCIAGGIGSYAFTSWAEARLKKVAKKDIPAETQVNGGADETAEASGNTQTDEDGTDGNGRL